MWLMKCILHLMAGMFALSVAIGNGQPEVGWTSLAFACAFALIEIIAAIASDDDSGNGPRQT